MFFPSLCVGGLSAERPAIVLYDGIQTHVLLALIEKCLEQNVYLYLRTPHKTALLQGEDIVVFPYVAFQLFTNPLTLDCRVLKSHFNACVDKLTALRNADVDDNCVLRELMWTDICEDLRMAFERIDALNRIDRYRDASTCMNENALSTRHVLPRSKHRRTW